MRMLLPTLVTDDILVSSSIAETDEPAWSGSTTYALGARVMKAHVIYESLAASNLNHDPATQPLWWTAIGPTNRWAMFDGTSATASEDASPITVVLDLPAVGEMVLLEIVADTVSLSGPGLSLTRSVPEPVLPATTSTLRISGLGFGGGELTITVSGTGTLSVGTLSVGNEVDLGVTQMGATVGMIDYSSRKTDEFGNITVTRRGYSRRVSARVAVPPEDFDDVAAILSSVRATPCVWNVSPRHEALNLFGYYTEWSLDVSYPTLTFYSITLESLSLANLSIGAGGSVAPELDTLALFNFTGSTVADEVPDNSAYGLSYVGQDWGTVYDGSPTLTLVSSTLGGNRALATNTIGASVAWDEKTPVHLMSGKATTAPAGVQVGTGGVYPVTEYPEQYGFSSGGLAASARGYSFDFDREVSADGFSIECSIWLSGRNMGASSGNSASYFDGAMAVLKNQTSGEYRIFHLYAWNYVENVAGSPYREVWVGLEVVDPHSGVAKLSEAEITASPGDLKHLCGQYNWANDTMDVYVDGSLIASEAIGQTTTAGDTNPDPADLRFGYGALVTHIDEFNPSSTIVGSITHRPYWDNFRVSRIVRRSGGTYSPPSGAFTLD
jgi:hypothetical protein